VTRVSCKGSCSGTCSGKREPGEESEVPEISETSSRSSSEQGRPVGRPAYGVADTLTLARLPLAVAFPLISDTAWRLAILGIAAATDLLDGPLARRFGGSRFGAVLDPVADKLFMAAAFGVVAFSGRLEWYEIVGVLLRDIVATVAFLVTVVSHRPRAIPARLGGKAVTVAQVLTLLTFLVDPPHLRPMAWATAAIALYAIWDYVRVAPAQGRRVGN
jgi:cardiolipin synthase (CMP-forming)